VTTCGFTAFGAVTVGFLKRHHFPLLLIQNNWQQKATNFNKYFRQVASIYFVPWEYKNISCQKSSGFFPSDFEFSFSAKFRDLLTSDYVISVLICISAIAFYSVLQYKHFEV